MAQGDADIVLFCEDEVFALAHRRCAERKHLEILGTVELVNRDAMFCGGCKGPLAD